jgi:hypothetical protein
MSKVTIEVQKPLGIILNNVGANLLLKGLKALPEEDKKTVVFNKLISDLETVVTIWDRRSKNAKILEKIRAQQQSVRRSQISSSQPPQQNQLRQPAK